MGLLMGVLNLILDGHFKQYFRRWTENRLLHFVLLFYFFCWLSLLWSANLWEGLDQLRRLTTLLLLPLIITAKPLPQPRKIKGLLSIFLAAVVITSLVNSIAFHFFAKQLELIDIRQMSLFGSHIRFGILVAFAFSIVLERIKENKWHFLLLFWLAFYTYESQVLTGYLALFIILFGQLIWRYYLKEKFIQIYLLLGAVVISVGSMVFYLSKPIEYRETCPMNPNSLKVAWVEKSKLPFDKTTPFTPPNLNKNKKPVAKYIDVVISITPPILVEIQLKILTPVGTAIIIVAAVK
jgi:hypothetical protein